MNSPKVLIIEDNPTIATNLYDYLDGHGFDVDTVKDGNDGFQILKDNSFDVILLDLGLPGMNGIELCRQFRQEVGGDTPILMITARDTLQDKLTGFQSGADDYLVKPFALEEVEARINSLYKRHNTQNSDRVIQFGNLTFNPENKMVIYAGVTVELPPKCIRIVEILLTNPEKLFSRRDLEKQLWGHKQDTSDRLRHHISILRRAFSQAGGQNIIKTVHGQGYSLSIEN